MSDTTTLKMHYSSRDNKFSDYNEDDADENEIINFIQNDKYGSLKNIVSISNNYDYNANKNQQQILFDTAITEITKIVTCDNRTSLLRSWGYNTKYGYNEENDYKLTSEDYIQGLSYNQMLHHIGMRCKELNKPEILKNAVGLSDESTEFSIKYVQKHIDSTIVQGEEKDILTEKDFICSPILVNEHWTVAVISKGEINIFDPTLQTKVRKRDYCKLKIGDIKEEQTFNCLNKDYKIQEHSTESKICGLCSAEFIIEASQCKSLKHLKDNMDIICNNVTTNIIRAIGSENAKGQLTESFQHNSEISPLRPESTDNVHKPKPTRTAKGSLERVVIEKNGQRCVRKLRYNQSTGNLGYLNSLKRCSNLSNSNKVNKTAFLNTPTTDSEQLPPKTLKGNMSSGVFNRK